jgi:hypothetical protein
MSIADSFGTVHLKFDFLPTGPQSVKVKDSPRDVPAPDVTSPKVFCHLPVLADRHL